MRVEPADPTSREPVSLVVQFYASCPAPLQVTRNGSEITAVTNSGSCLSPLGLVTQRADLGVLPAGVYHVRDAASPAATALTFTVLDANSSVSVLPAVGRTAGGAIVDIYADVNQCGDAAPASCAPPVITFNGVPATGVNVLGRTQFRAMVPPGLAGAALVTVRGTTVTRASYAFRYYDPAAAALPEIFERILVPVFYNGPGVNGSSWATEVAVQNANSYAVEFYRGPDQVPSIAAGATSRLGFEAAPGGIFMIVPRGSGAGLRANAMIRDVSRPMQAWGTELPIVRERDFVSDLTLLNVPAYPGYRTMLRIYSSESLPAFGQVTMFSMDDGRTLGQRAFTLESVQPCTSIETCTSNRPASIAIPDITDKLPVVNAGERVGIRVQSFDARVWAFATITNNETQHVAIVSPQ